MDALRPVSSSVKDRCYCLPLAARCLEPDESAPQTSVKHRRFQQDNELFCSGERFHSVSPVLTGEGSGQKNRERERGRATQPSLPFPFHSRRPRRPRRPILHTAVKFSHRCVGGRRGGVVVSRGSFISARRPQNPVVRSLSHVSRMPHITRHMERNFWHDTVRIIRTEGWNNDAVRLTDSIWSE